jgi:quinohemoprotein ethanol dehydrogenase
MTQLRARRLFSATALTMALLAGCQQDDSSNQQSAAPSATSQPAAATQQQITGRANVNDARLQNAANEPGQWLMVGGTYDERHYSPLDEINRDNLDQLGLAWFADYDTNLSQQGTPLYVDGVIYVSTAWSKVYAFDARTGAQLWQYDPKTPGEIAVKVCCGIVNRGIAAYDGKIYLGTLEGYLVAIDANTGAEVWRKMTVNPDEQYTVTSAPRIVKGKVLIGNSGSEFGVRGYLGAYDANTGDDLWRVYTVPGNPELGFESPELAMAAQTWGTDGTWWQLGGGGTVWDAIVYDEQSNLIIFGTGNGTPWDQRARDPSGGDNLFVASIIAVDADTGVYAWHYQATPGDTWDYDAMSPIMLLDLTFEGEPRRVAVQPNKNGFLYVLDAATGELLKADAFTEVNWATGVDMATGRPIEVPEARYDHENIFNLSPGVQGAKGWHKNAWNPETGYIYISAQRSYFVMQSLEDFTVNPVGTNLAINMGANFMYYRDNPEAPREFVGFVSAWDPVQGREVWRSEENNGPTGSVLSTAGGLVFSGGGNNTNEFRAYHTVTGEKLWSFDTQTGVVSAPITYELDGKQYIALSVGINQAGNYYAPNYSRMLVFTLGGDAQLPQPLTFTPPPLNPPPATASEAEVAQGQAHYNQHCSTCHGNGGAARGANFPNLMVSPMLHSQEGFDQIVLGGVRQERGMVSFAERLQPAESAAIRAYLIAQANQQLAAQQAAPPIESVDAPEQMHEETETRDN